MNFYVVKKKISTLPDSINFPFSPFIRRIRVGTQYGVSFFQNFKENVNGFLLDEEVAPDGMTHGGYGFVDDQGDLLYVEYKKSPKGQV